MIDFNVRRNFGYWELTIENNNTKMTTGLLDDLEATNIAESLIIAAEALLPSEYNAESEALGKIRESL